MPKFRALPVEREAREYRATYQGAQEIIDWINKETKFDPRSGHDPVAMYYYGALTIRTLEGDLTASDGDWIIQGVEGEFYACKPNIFDKTYELISDE